MVGTDLKGLGLAHHKPDLFGFLVFEKLHSPNTSLFPLVSFLVKSVKLAFPAMTRMNP